MTTTPILFLIFNRPDTTKRVFEIIREARPSKLYVAADGARKDKIGEDTIVKEVRKIATNVDWNCELTTFFHKENLGCKIAVSSAITWFFEQEEEGIILEDDCLPNQSFFRFCEQVLSEYRNDTRVMMIAGTNYLFNNKLESREYFFSRYYAIWGWASWRRAWQKYDIEMKEWPTYKELGYLESIFSDENISQFYTQMFDQAYNGGIDTWDLQWVYSCVFNHGLSVVSTKNLIANIGKNGTHTTEDGSVSKFFNMPTSEIENQMTHINLKIFPNPQLDDLTFSNIGILKNADQKLSRIDKAIAKIKKKLGWC